MGNFYPYILGGTRFTFSVASLGYQAHNKKGLIQWLIITLFVNQSFYFGNLDFELCMLSLVELQLFVRAA